jgi:hypothetical protein
MKVWISAMAGLVIFIGLALYVQVQMQNTSDKLAQEIEKVNITLRFQQWDLSLAKLKIVKQKWERTKPFWAMLIIHREIDSIDEALIRAMKAIQSKNDSEAQMELGSLQHYIQHIPERERFNLVNIL